MLTPDLADLIGRLDPGSLTAFTGALLQSEAWRLGQPATSVILSHQLSVPDGGLDVLVRDLPTGGPLPAGTSGWQLKSSGGTLSRLKLDDELRKPGVIELLTGGGTYVLLWPRQLNPREHARVIDRLRSAAPPNTQVEQLVLFDATALTALATRHPAIVETFGLSAFAALRSMEELGKELRHARRPYVPDEARLQLGAALQDRMTADTPEVVRAVVLGLPGTGKTRLVYETLKSTELFGQALYTDTWSGMEQFLAWASREPRSQGVLVVDDFGPDANLHGLRHLEARLVDPESGAGRWRVIAIQSIVDSREHPNGLRDLVLPPLSYAATARLLEATDDLDPALARQIAESAEGFPALAFALARSAKDNPAMALRDLVHLREPSALLRRAVDNDEVRRMLGPLALFGTVFVDRGESDELAAVAAAFRLPAAKMRGVVERERRRNRYVAKAGQHRFVTPQALAVWLAIDVIEETGDFDQVIADLPRGLRRAFHDQLALFGGTNDALAETLERMIASSGLLAPERFDDVAADLVRAAATTIPMTVARELTSMLTACDDEALRRLPRAGLVGAIIRLVRHAETMQDGLAALFVLARVESTGGVARARFLEAFHPRAGATEAALLTRLDWLRHCIEQPVDDLGRQLLIDACHTMAAAQTSDGDGTRQTDVLDLMRQRPTAAERWRQRDAPDEAHLDSTSTGHTIPSLLAFQRAGADGLLRCLSLASQPTALSCLPLIVPLLDDLSSSQLDVANQLVRDCRIDANAGAPILRSLLRDDAAGAREDDARAALVETLLGETPSERARALLALRRHDVLQFERSDARKRPRTVARPGPLLADVAAQLAAEPGAWREVAAAESIDDEVAAELWRGVARRAGARRVFETLGDISRTAVTGALSVADDVGEGRWASGLLAEMLEVGNLEGAVEVVSVLSPRDHRIASVLRALDDDADDVSSLPLAGLTGVEATARLSDSVTASTVRRLRSQGLSLAAAGLLAPALGASGGGSQVCDLADELLADPQAWRPDEGAALGATHELVEAVEHWCGRAEARDDPAATLRLAPISVASRLATRRPLDEARLDAGVELAADAGRAPLRLLSVADELLGGAWRLNGHVSQLLARHADWSEKQPGALQRRALTLPWLDQIVDEIAIAFVEQQHDADEAIQAWRRALADTPAFDGVTLLAARLPQ